MREQDNLATLIDDADAWADQFCSSLPGPGASAQLSSASPLLEKARAYRELLYCRFADQAFSAARSARHGRPASTSSLTCSAFETFTHLFELRDHLETAFARNSLDALDTLLATRLFGSNAEPAEQQAEEFSLGLEDDEADLPEIALPIADNDGALAEQPRIDPGASEEDRRADLALRRLMQTLIAIETSFDNCYRALDVPMARLEDMFGDSLRH